MDPTPILVPAILDLSSTHLIIILIIALLLFGSRLPAIMRGLGGSVREFKAGMSEATPPPAPAPPPAGQVARDTAPPAAPATPPQTPGKN